MDETRLATPPGPGFLAYGPDGAVGWARLTPRSMLTWLHERFGISPTKDTEVWSMPCFYVSAGWRRRGVMSALIAAGTETADTHDFALEAYPVDPNVDGATRNRFAGVLDPFLQAGFTEVARLTKDRAIVRYQSAKG